MNGKVNIYYLTDGEREHVLTVADTFSEPERSLIPKYYHAGRQAGNGHDDALKGAERRAHSTDPLRRQVA